MAAVQTARMGRTVLLVAPEKNVGGIVVDGLDGADINNHWFQNDVAVRGLARGLDDAVSLLQPESSGTGFFCHGLAWGVDRGILAGQNHREPVARAMLGLANSVSPEGRVLWGQKVDSRTNPAARESAHEYVTETVLLAASEV
jgi:hypothetical protein